MTRKSADGSSGSDPIPSVHMWVDAWAGADGFFDEPPPVTVRPPASPPSWSPAELLPGDSRPGTFVNQPPPVVASQSFAPPPSPIAPRRPIAPQGFVAPPGPITPQRPVAASDRSGSHGFGRSAWRWWVSGGAAMATLVLLVAVAAKMWTAGSSKPMPTPATVTVTQPATSPESSALVPNTAGAAALSLIHI